MRVRRVLPLVLSVLLAATPLLAGSPPLTVSPGEPSTLALIADPCPTFSWGEVDGAKSYELVVYRLGDDGEEAQPVLRQDFAGPVYGWTPALGSCLERGGQYAWSVRAVVPGEASVWSAPRLLQVASGPSEAAFEAALEVVRSYISIEREGAESVSTAEESEVSAAAPGEPKRSTTSRAPGTAAPVPPSLLSVLGTIDAVSFSGDGSNLTGLNPDPPCFDTGKRFVNCNNGTVTDTLTGLIYLHDASCAALPGTGPDGQANWVDANAAAAALQDGLCGLTDGSRAGDWRLQTREEWEGIYKSSCATDPEIVGNQSPAPGCYTDVDDSDSEWASGVSSLYWTSTTRADSTTSAWAACLGVGAECLSGKTAVTLYVWPVRGGE